MEQALHKGQKIAVRIGTDALGDTIASIPTLRKISKAQTCLLYTSPSPRDRQKSRMPSSA